MKYIYNPVSGTLDETSKIGLKKESKTPIQPRTDSSKTKQIPKVKEKTDVLDYIDRMQHMYEGTPLSDKNKRIDKTKRTKDNIDPNRPVISDNDVVFATMNPQEALNFTKGDPEKIKFMRQVKAQNRKQEEYDNNKKIRIDPVKINLDPMLDTLIEEPIRPNLTVRKDPDLEKGIATILKKKF